MGRAMKIKFWLMLLAVSGVALGRPCVAAEPVVLGESALDRIVAGDVQAKVTIGSTVVFNHTYAVDVAPLKGTIVDLPLWVPVVGTVTVKVVAL